jgi:hypothetical protein
LAEILSNTRPLPQGRSRAPHEWRKRQHDRVQQGDRIGVGQATALGQQNVGNSGLPRSRRAATR